MNSERVMFAVEIEGVPAGDYALRVDGVEVGTIQAFARHNGEIFGRLSFRSQADRRNSLRAFPDILDICSRPNDELDLGEICGSSGEARVASAVKSAFFRQEFAYLLHW